MEKLGLNVLTRDGVISSPLMLMRRLYIYYLTTWKNHTIAFTDSINSFKWMMAEYDGVNDLKFKSEVEDDLRKLFNSYFEEVEITLNTTVNKDNEDILELYLNIKVVHNGKSYTLDESLKADLVNGRYVNLDEDWVSLETYSNFKH